MSRPVALVVGVGPGLGAAAARRLTNLGHHVVLASRSPDRHHDLASELEGTTLRIDATDPDSVRAGIAQVQETLGPIETVVWNVGGGVFGTLDRVDLDGLDRTLGTNTRGLFVLAKVLLPEMAARGAGSLIVTGATASLRGKPFTTAFAPGKAAQRSLAQALARAYGPKGVHVAYIIVDGQVGAPAMLARSPDRNPEEFVDPEGFADAVAFLIGQRRGAWTFELDIRPHLEAW